MMKFSKLAILGAVLAASAQYASALPIPVGEINFTGNGGLTGTNGNLLAVTVTNPTSYLQIATGTFSSFPVLPTIQPVTVTGFTNLTVPALIFTTSFGGNTITFTGTTFISSSVSASASSELIGGTLTETGYASSYQILDLTSVANATTFTADLVTSATPEPSSLVLLGSGLVSAAGVMVRRRRTVSA